MDKKPGWIAATAVLAALAAIAGIGWWRATRPMAHPLVRFSTEMAPVPGTAYGYYLDKNLWNDLANLFAANGWLGQFLVPLGIKGAYSRLGVIIALTFVGMPFVVRTLQPVIENIEREVEEASATLGAGPTLSIIDMLRGEFNTEIPAVLFGAASLALLILCLRRVVGLRRSVPADRRRPPSV